MSSYSEALKEHILALSHAGSFVDACREWSLVNIYVTEEFDNCPCGKEIKEHCEISNRVTGRSTFVGNVCINRFIRLKTGPLFDGLRRLQADAAGNANEALIAYAEARGYLFEGEAVFLRRTARKRNLSPKQIAWKEKISRRILQRVVVRRLPPTRRNDA